MFRYFAMNRGAEATRTVDPYSLYFQGGQWYVVGRDHDRDDMRVFRVSRIRGDLRFATRRERDFQFPEGFDPGTYRDRAPWQLGEAQGEAVLEITPSAAWLVERLFGRHGTVEIRDDRGARFATPYASLELLATWVIGMDGQALPVSPPELVDEVVGALERGLPRPRGRRAADRGADRDRARAGDRAGAPRRSSPVAPERFAVLQAMLADLLESCGDEPRGEISATDLKERYGLTDDALVEQVNLLNLVNFGGGCYAVYAEFDGDTIEVEKELYGEEFRRPARLSPLEAKAILMALDLVGPQVAAGAGTTLGDVRRKVESAFGRFALRETPTPVAQREAEGILSAINDSIRNRRLVRVEYLGAQRRRHDGARRRAVPAARRRLRLVPRELRPHRRRRAHVPRRPHPRRRAAARDVRAPRRPRGAGRAARAARPLRHRLGVVRARDRAPARRRRCRPARRSSTAPRWRPSPTAPSAGWRPRSSSTAATPC